MNTLRPETKQIQQRGASILTSKWNMAICPKSYRFTEIWRLMEQIEALIAQRYLRNISAECGIEMG